MNNDYSEDARGFLVFFIKKTAPIAISAVILFSTIGLLAGG